MSNATWWPTPPDKPDGPQLVARFKSERPDAYARWFLLEAIGLGAEPVWSEGRDFLRAHSTSQHLSDELMAMRGVIWNEASGFLKDVIRQSDDGQIVQAVRALREIGLAPAADES